MHEPTVSLPQAQGTPARASGGVVSDSELLVAIAARDRAAFGVLYQRYARAVFGLALGRLGERGRAEDAVQETFTAIWRARPRATAPSAALERPGSSASPATR